MVIGITGATGFVGRHVSALALTQGHEVVAFSRQPTAPVAGAREVRSWSADTPPDLSGLDAVIHLAGASVLGLWTRKKREAIRSSRVLGTRQLVAALHQSPSQSRPTSFVCASAIGFYGNRGDEELTESSAPGTGFLADVTQAWEVEALRAQAAGVRVVCGRIGLVLGSGGGAWPILHTVFRSGLGGRLGSGRQWTSWVHVNDVARLLLTAATHPQWHGVMNVVSPHPVTNTELTRTLAQSLHRPAILPVPAPLLKTLLRDQAGLFLDSQRVTPKVALDHGFTHSFPTLHTAVKNLIGN
jgi:uncharacterized protein (TIGR01777 family)